MEPDQSPAAKAIMGALHWLYERVTASKLTTPMPTPGPGQGSEEHIESLIRWTAAQAGLVGFTTNLGGLITLPFSLPANVAGVSALQLNMITEIARARGYDLQSEQVKVLSIACLAGGAALDILKNADVNVSTRLTQRALTGIAGAALGRINQAVGARRLTARAGGLGLLNVSKFVPFVGGLVGGTVDGLATAGIAAVAKRVFVRKEDAGPGEEAPVLSLPSPAVS